MNLEDLKLKLTAVFEPAPEGGYTCHFEELPEVFSEGETLEEAKANLLDALVQVMDYHREEARKSTTPGTVREELTLALRETGRLGTASCRPWLPSDITSISQRLPGFKGVKVLSNT